MVDILRVAHSWTAILALIMIVVALFKALTSWIGKQEFGKSHNGIYASAVGFLHLQLLLGLILYFVGGKGMSLFSRGMKEVMGDATLRFFAVEHITGMILAIIIAQVARTVSKKKKSHSVMFIGLLIATLVLVGSIPWVRGIAGIPVVRGF